MSVRKLNSELEASSVAPLTVGLSFQHDLYELADGVLATRAMRTFEANVSRYAVHRLVRCAALRKRAEVFDDLALHSGFAAMRLSEGSLLLDGPDVFIQAKGWVNSKYCSCEFGIWADSIARLNTARDRLLQIVGERIDRDRMFTVDWNFTTGRGTLNSASFDEVVDDEALDEAYPSLRMSVRDFIERFLNAPETVLVLQGPPGTGKTRLVRAILAGMSKRKNEPAKIMYTADKKAFEGDEIFVDFITGSHDAFVIEDADHLLKARSSGNQELHRFLTIADGVARAQGRKIIFTTNLPNITDIDDALLRPGRCFASVHMRPLDRIEATQLVRRLNAFHDEGALVERLFANGVKSTSVASVYRLINTSVAAN
jgi:hypothetical protein